MCVTVQNYTCKIHNTKPQSIPARASDCVVPFIMSFGEIFSAQIELGVEIVYIGVE